MMASSGGTLLDLEETSFLVFECILLYCWKWHGVEKEQQKPEMEEEEEEDVCI